MAVWEKEEEEEDAGDDDEKREHNEWEEFMNNNECSGEKWLEVYLFTITHKIGFI